MTSDSPRAVLVELAVSNLLLGAAVVADIPGHVVPAWHEVEIGTWQEWDTERAGERLLVNTTDTARAVAQVVLRLAP